MLNASLYGTQDAQRSWEHKYSHEPKAMVFKRGRANPTYWHKGWEVRLVVHGDLFFCSGPDHQLVIFVAAMQSIFEVAIIGPKEDQQKELVMLSGKIRWTRRGLTWEADPRHVMDHEGVAPQGSCKDAQRQLTTGEENGVEMSAEEAKQYKSVAARANCLGLDRPDFQFTSRALCKRMSKPTKGDFEHVKRLGRYLRSHPRAM